MSEDRRAGTNGARSHVNGVDPNGALPLVSVVIPTHNRPELVRRALASVTDQTYAGPIECIVVHDKEPADATLESSDPRRPVRAIENGHTPGLAGARNAGLDVANGEMVASLDDDDYWIDGKVAAQVSALLAEPELLVTATGVVLHTADGKVWERPAAGPKVTHDDLLRARIADLHSSNLMMRRTAFDRVGPYDEDLVGVEDWEWLLRASKEHPIHVVQRHLIHVFRDTPLWRPERWRRIARAHEQVLERHPDLAANRDSAGYFFAKLAFAHAAAGNRREARRLAGRALVRKAVNPWAIAAVLIAVARVPVRWVQVGANRVGRSI
jgi:glycosyltransferase involved in cell wall biosynthesis